MGDAVGVPALQVIVLGSGGGPIESNTTAFLVRSTATKWEKGTLLAVDAGVHLAAIVKILETHKTDQREKNSQAPVTLIDGPFAGFRLPHVSIKANAAHITRNLVDTYLITHPHLDHISGLVVNTASLPLHRAKRIAGLPSTIQAFKDHIFNNVIWPNLSDENNGAGLVTYMRLVEGGSLAIGEGAGKGYAEVCEGLSVKTWSVSHGHCIENHSHRGSGQSPMPNIHVQSDESPRLRSMHGSQTQRSPSNASMSGGDFSRPENLFRSTYCVYDSSAHFIRDTATGNELIIFGDVEPDSISLSPRNRQVWREAAPKIASGQLKGIFIECSYDDSQPEETLFGHLAPRYLIEEMKALAIEVQSFNREEKIGKSKKRKRPSVGDMPGSNGSRRRTSPRLSPGSSLQATSVPSTVERLGDNENLQGEEFPLPMRGQTPLQLTGLKIVIIHVKEKLNDGPDVSETILRELKEQAEDAGLGCEFIISKAGEALYL